MKNKNYIVKNTFSVYKFRAIMLFAVAAFATLQLNAQVTVNPGAVSYTTVNAAFTAINSGAHTGAVTIAIASNTTEPATPVTLAASGVGSANYASITIYPTAAAVIVSGATITGRSILEFNGADNITINGNINNGAGATRNLTIRNTTTNTFPHSVLWFQGTTTSPQLGCTNIIIKNTILHGNGNSGGTSGTTTYSTGIAFAGTTFPTSTTLGANHQTITITNNQFKQVNTGIHIANATTTPVLNLQIDNNEIGSATASEYVYYRGMFLSSTSGTIIRLNHIYNIRPSLTTQTLTRTGIEISGTGSASITIDRNNIHGMGTFSTSGYGGIGISLGGGNSHLVLNNLVYDLDGYGSSAITNGPQGIRLESGTGHKVYYNSVHLFGNLTGTTTRYSGAFTVAATSVTGIDVRNNIFSNRMVPTSGTAENMAMWFVASYDFAASGNIINNNAFFVTPSSANHFVGKVGVTVGSGTYQTLAAWQTISGGDGQSIPAANAFAPFTSNTNLTIPAGTATGCESGGVAIASLGLPNTDYSGVNRPAGTGFVPDMGAYEFSGAGCTTPPTPGSATKTPATAVCPNTSVTLNLTGHTSGSGQAYQWFSDPSQFGSYTTAVSGVSGASYFTINPTSTLWYRCVVTCGGNSQNSAPVEVVVTPGLNGTYTIDPSGSGSTNFTTFNAAITALGTCGVMGPVIFNVAAANTFTEQITIPVILNSSAVNNVTFNGNGSTLQFASTNTALRHVIKLDGADYVTIDNLIINANPGGGTYGWGVHFINQADHNTISNCTISTSTTDVTSGNYYGIIMSNSTSSVSAGNSANYTMISGNTITGGYYTVAFYGQTTVGIKAQSNSLINNIIRDSYGYTCYLIYQVNMVVRGNDVSRPTRSASILTAGGIYTSSGDGGSLVEKNYVHDMYQSIPGGTTTMYGIYHGNDATVGAPDIVQNNVIYNMNNSNNTIYGLYNSGSPYVKYYHNSISLNDVSATSTAATHGMYQTSAAAGVEYINNVVSVTRGGSGTKTCINLNNASNTIISNNNDLYMNSSGGFTGMWGANTYPSLGDWQTANTNAYDANSFGVNPGFVSASTGNLKPTSSIIDNIGQNLGVPTDILGIARTSTPDPGAYEFVPVTLDASITWVSPNTPVTGGLNTITVSVTNNQSTAITDLVLGYTDGVTPQSQTFSGLNITIGNSQQFSFTTQYNIGGASVPLQGYITSVNGLTDANQLNDTTATQVLCAGLTGGYTINSGVATGGSNFQTFNAAINRLICGGVLGAVTFNVVASTGPYTEQIAIPPIAGASAGNTITFNGNGNTLTYSLTNASARHVIRLEGADYITINNLTIIATAGTYGWGVHFYNGADYNTISNCTINVGASSSVAAEFAAIVMSNSFTTPTTTGNNGNFNTITGNTLSGGYYTITAYGNSAAGLQNLNNTISNNILTNSYDNTIYILGQKNIIVSGNDISRPTRTTVSTPSGIALSTGCLNSLIEKNRIHNSFGAILTNTATSYGINVTADGTPAEPNRIENNLIYDIQGNGTIYGIYNSGAEYMLAYHNTISLDYTPSTAGIAYGFYQVTVAPGIEFRNNIITITRGGTGAKYGLYFSTTGATVNSNNNDIYLNSAGTGAQYIGNYVSATFSTLALWQGANGSAWDQQSHSVNPGYTNPSTGNFYPTSSLIDNIGVNVYVTTDILGAARSATTPDAGAYEFTPVNLDAAIAWIAPVAPFTPGLNTVTVNITNNQSATITSLDLAYTNGVTPVTQNFPGLNILQSASQQFSFTTQYDITGNATLRAYITNVNGILDGNQANDTTAAQELCVPVAGGTYTINSTIGTGGTNFQSFSAAFGRLAYCGMAGPIVFNVVAGSGPYNEQLTIPVISGSSAVNTITVNGNGRTIRASSSVGAKHVIGINGADYISFDNLIIESLNTTYGIGVHLTNAADHIAITNCTINLTATTSTTEDNSAGIVSSASAADVNLQGNNASYLTITGNTIISGYQGIILNGATGGLNATNIVINNNTIRDFYANGISLSNNNGTQINTNNINRATRVGVTTFTGVELLAGNSNVLINANRIHDTHTSATTQTGAAYGVYSNLCDALSGAENKIINNLFYNFNSATGTIYGIYNTGSDGSYMYHNTIALNNAASTAGTTNGFYQTTAAVNIRFINNIVSITRGGTGTKNCVYFNTTGSSITSNNNDLYINAPAGTNGVGFYTLNYATLAGWQGANGGAYDALSKSLNPGFVNPGTGDFTPTQSQLNAMGANMGVTTDINGNPRSALPDVGAYEFTTVGLDAGITWVAPVSPLTAGLKTITVNIVNTQTATITDLDLAYTDGTITETESFTGLNIPASGSQQISFTDQYNLTTTSSLRAYISNVNTILDTDQTNDTTAIQNLCIPMTGAYTINSTLPASATNFQSFNAAVDQLICGGVSSAVTFTVGASSGPYNEQVIIPSINGASAANTITFNGGGRTLTYTSTDANQRATITLNDADYITINNLVILAPGTATTEYGYGVQMINNADNNTISNCTITTTSAPATASSVSFAGVVINTGAVAVTTGNSQCDNNTISGCTITGGYYGIVMVANGTVNMINGNQVLNNIVREFYEYGMYINGNNGALIQGNSLSRPTRSSVTTFRGIGLSGNNLNTVINRNRLFNPFGGATGSTAAGFGIYHTSCDATLGNENIVSNNLIYGHIGSSGNHNGILNVGSDYVKYYHNTIVLNDVNATCTTCAGRGFYQQSPHPIGLEFVNNIVAISQGGDAPKECIFFENPSVSNYVLNGNNYYITSTGGALNEVARTGGSSTIPTQGTGYLTILDWQTGSGQEVNSVSINPLFTSPGTGNYAPQVIQADNIGVPVGILTDINSAARSVSTPDAGAYEYTGTLNNFCTGMPVAGTASGSNNLCNNQSTTLRVVNYTSLVGISLQWKQSSVTGGPYVPVTGGTGATTATYVTPLLATTTYYVCQVSCSGGSSAITNEVAVVVTAPALSNPVGDVRCGYGIVDLSAASSTGQVAWYDQPTGGTLLATGTTYSPTVSTTTNFYAAAIEPLVQTPLSTGFNGGTIATDPNAAGNMFNISAINEVTINSFDIHLENDGNLLPSNISIYYKVGTYIGYTTNSAPWILLGSATGITSNGTGVPTPLPISLNLTIPAGQVYGFYIVVTNLGVANSLRYNSAATSPAEGAVAASDFNIQVQSGTTVFGPFTGLPAAPTKRKWNGRVNYTYNCEGPRTAILATVNPPPPVTVTVQHPVICSGQSATLIATSSNAGYTYTWNPGNLSGPSITVTPATTTVYTLLASDTSGGTYDQCAAIQTITVSTSSSQPPSPLASSNAPVCEGFPLTLFGDNVASGQSSGNTWSWSGPSYASSSQNPSVSSTATSAMSGTYMLTVTNSSGCTASASTGVSVNPNPVLVIGSQTNVSCNGELDGEVDIDATSGTSPFVFDLDGLPTLDGIYTGLGAGTYTATCIDDAGCEATSLMVTITEPDVLTVTAGSNTPVCPGTPLNLTSTPLGGTTAYGYAWTGPNGPVPAVQNPVINPSTSADAGQYTVTVTDANGCTATASHTVFIYTASTAPTSVTSDDPDNEICSGQNVLLTSNGGALGNAPGASYKWYEGGCGTGSALGSASTLNVINPTAGSHTYYVRIEDACGNTSCSSITILVSGAPPGVVTGTFTGPSYACSGTVSLVTVNPISGSNIHYSWNIGTNSSVVLFSTNIGGPFSPGPFSTPTNQVYAQFGALGAGHSGYYVCVQGVNACGSTTNRCLSIRGTVSGPGLIAPADPLACPNDVKNYTCGASAGATVYNWTLSGSATPITSGQGTTAVTVTFPPAFTTGQLCVTAALACGGSSTSPPRCMTISNTPAIPGTMTGPSKVCPGATGVAFSVPLVTGATGYNWTVPSGCTIATGTGTNAITVNFPTPYTGAPSVCVSATGACGTSVQRCKTVGTNIPSMPGNITGPNSNICNSTVQYSIANVSGATGYTWTSPAGTTISNGQGTTTILLSVGSSFTTGTLSVTANTSLCTPGSSTARTITIVGKPSTPGTITAAPGTWCAGGFVNFSVVPAAPLPTYTWFVATGTIDAGQGSNNIDVTWGAGAGNVNVTASNGCGASGTRSQSFSSSCREEEELSATDNTDNFAVYPNPAHDNVTVSIYVKEAAQFNIKLRDLSGRIILSEDRNGSAGLNTYDMELKNFAKGLYTLEVKAADKSWKSKVVVE